MLSWVHTHTCMCTHMHTPIVLLSHVFIQSEAINFYLCNTHTQSAHYTPFPYFDDMQIFLPPSFLSPTCTHTLITCRLMLCGSVHRQAGRINFSPSVLPIFTR